MNSMTNTRKSLHMYFKKILSNEKKRTHILSIIITSILLVLSSFMCILNLFTGTRYLVFVTGGLAVVLTFILFIFIKTHKEKIGLFLLAISIISLLTLLLINGGVDGFSSIWIVILPTAVFSLYGHFFKKYPSCKNPTF